MSIAIRPATAADCDRCLDLLTLLGGPDGRQRPANAEETFALLVGGERGEILVAEEDGQLLGMASQSYTVALRFGGEYSHLEELIVDPAARGRNLGGLLLQAGIAAARARGAAEYGLYLVSWTEHNQPFYEKYGLEKVGAEMRMRL